MSISGHLAYLSHKLRPLAFQGLPDESLLRALQVMHYSFESLYAQGEKLDSRANPTLEWFMGERGNSRGSGQSR